MHLLLLIFLLIGNVFGKVRILTFHYNQASFIEIQKRCLNQFLLDDHELIVFNDASTQENERAIRETCERLQILCVRFQPEWHLTHPLNDEIRKWFKDPALKDPAFIGPQFFENQGSIRHSHVIQYALDHFGYDHDDAVAIMDGDAFFIRPFSLREKLKTFDIFGMTREIKEKDVSYLWVPFIAFHPKKLPNLKDLKFNVSLINHKIHDTGAQSFYYLANNPSVKCEKTFPVPSHRLRRLSKNQLKQAGYNSKERWLIKHLPKPSSVEFNIENCVLHFREVSFEMKSHQDKASFLMQFINKIIGD